MSIDDQRTQPLVLVSERNAFAHADYQWLKRLSESSGVRLLHLYLLLQGKQVVGADQARVAQVLLQLARQRKWA